MQTQNEQTETVPVQPIVMQCPECGKPMKECDGWPGLWICIDGLKPMNDSAPYKYKCNGKHITERGSELFYEEIERQIAQSN
jgi:hypothetical protein